jgi:hypothetical protein
MPLVSKAMDVFREQVFLKIRFELKTQIIHFIDEDRNNRPVEYGMLKNAVDVRSCYLFILFYFYFIVFYFIFFWFFYVCIFFFFFFCFFFFVFECVYEGNVFFSFFLSFFFLKLFSRMKERSVNYYDDLEKKILGMLNVLISRVCVCVCVFFYENILILWRYFVLNLSWDIYIYIYIYIYTYIL